MTVEVTQCSTFRRGAEAGLHVSKGASAARSVVVQRQGSTSPKMPVTVDVTQCNAFRRGAEAGLHVPKGADDS